MAEEITNPSEELISPIEETASPSDEMTGGGSVATETKPSVSKVDMLWNALSKDDVYKNKVGSIDEFRTKMQNPEKAKMLWNALSKDEVYASKVGDEKTFLSKVSSPKPLAPSTKGGESGAVKTPSTSTSVLEDLESGSWTKTISPNKQEQPVSKPVIEVPKSVKQVEEVKKLSNQTLGEILKKSQEGYINPDLEAVVGSIALPGGGSVPLKEGKIADFTTKRSIVPNKDMETDIDILVDRTNVTRDLKRNSEDRLQNLSNGIKQIQEEGAFLNEKYKSNPTPELEAELNQLVKNLQQTQREYNLESFRRDVYEKRILQTSDSIKKLANDQVPEDFFSGIYQGWRGNVDSWGKSYNMAKMNKKELIQFAKDEGLKAPTKESSTSGGGGQMVGGVVNDVLVAAGFTLAGLPMVGATTVATRQGAQQAAEDFVRVFNEIKASGLPSGKKDANGNDIMRPASDDEAYDKAVRAAGFGAVTGFAEGMVGATPIGGALAVAVGKKAVTQKAKIAAMKAVDTGLDAAVAGGMQFSRNLYDRAQGLKTELGSGVLENMAGEVLLSAPINTISGVVEYNAENKKKAVKEIFQAVENYKSNPNELIKLEENLDILKNQGLISDSDHSAMKKRVSQYMSVIETIPSEIKEKQEVADMIIERNELEDKKKSVDKAFQKGIDEQIENINNKLVEKANEAKPIELKKNTSPTSDKYGTINRNDGKGVVDLTKEEYEAEQAKMQPKVDEQVTPTAEGEQVPKTKEEIVAEVELKNEGKAEAPTKESVTERLDINNPFYQKVEDALVKLGLIEKYNPETGTGDVVGGYAQQTSDGGFSAGKMLFSQDGSISYFDGDVKVSFDKNGNVISENTKEAKQKAVSLEIEGKKESIANLEKTRDSEAFKYKEVTETDVLGNKKKVKRLKTEQELKESTDKINAAIDKAKNELTELEKQYEKEPTKKEDGEPMSGGVQGVRPEGQAGKESAELRPEEEEVADPLKDVESTAKALEGVDKKEIEQKVLPNVIDIYKIQDDGAERILERSFKPNRVWVYKIENAGDIIRELSKYKNEFLDPSYIYEKVNKIEKFLKEQQNQLKVSPEDSYFQFKRQNEESVKDFISAYENLPTISEAQSVAKKMVLGLLNGNIDEAQKGIDYFNEIRKADDIKAELQKRNKYQISEAYHKAKAGGSNPELVKAVEELLGKPKEAAPQAGSVVGASLRDVELKMRRPEKNEVIFVSVDALLQKHAADQPSYDVQKEGNRIKGRVEKAKEFIKNYIKDQRAINPKTGERMNTKVSFEPSVVDIDANGKISFEDGRHRVLAAKEMGLTEVPIEVPKERVKSVEQSLQSTPQEGSVVSGEVVKDNKGQPLTLFHGTGKEFTDFDIEKTSGVTRYGKGVSFTDAKGIAIRYSLERQGLEDSQENDSKAIVKEANVSIKAPFDDRGKIDKDTPQAKKLIQILTERFGLNIGLVNNILDANIQSRNSAFQNISEAIFDKSTDKKTFMFKGDTEKTRAILEEAGYDSIIGEYEDATEYFIFNPKNILSKSLQAPKAEEKVSGGLTQEEKVNLENISKDAGVNFQEVRNVYNKYGEGKPLNEITLEDYQKAEEKRQEQKPTKTTEDAVQKQAAGQVPIQPKAGVSEEVEGGKPETKSEKATKESQKEIDELFDLYESIDESKGLDKRKAADDFRNMQQSIKNPTLKRIFDNISDIHSQLEKQGLITKTKGCP